MFCNQNELFKGERSKCLLWWRGEKKFCDDFSCLKFDDYVKRNLNKLGLNKKRVWEYKKLEVSDNAICYNLIKNFLRGLFQNLKKKVN